MIDVQRNITKKIEKIILKVSEIKDLNSIQKSCLASICIEFDYKNPHITNGLLAQYIGRTNKTAGRIIKELVLLGYIKYEIRDSYWRTLTPLI